ncbi:hypothetical protein [Neisseria chenwenguii]|uniref:Uncharacterized protein n=1 Tax=Neisseria chenwenguii TaxID=1853278 RepID=A0A220S3J6_9NEIS|nr:hypothetical protein [Neisseria chenwenguii]ASK28050.1 hypothetical protein BG910_10190 [Neisseria chenwenguii]
MKHYSLALAVSAVFIATSAMAEELADPDGIRPIKIFSPPKPITPNIAQGYFPENQFDPTCAEAVGTVSRLKRRNRTNVSSDDAAWRFAYGYAQKTVLTVPAA